jgi:hypothetical protein
MKPMTLEHERWQEFADRLAGPDGCNFHEGEDGILRWKCGGGRDKSLTLKALESMGSDIDIPATLVYFDEHGGHCDCEVIFNVDRRYSVLGDPRTGEVIWVGNGLDHLRN